MASSVKHRNAKVALVAALLFALQSLAGAFALAADTSSFRLDAFGNPLCITGADQDGAGHDRQGGHDAPAQCCALGCAMAGQGMAMPPADAAFPPRAALFAGPTIHENAFVLAAGRVHRPGNPRAPPPAA